MPAKILLVDDSLFGRKAAGQALLSTGFETMEASNGREALNRVADNPPDVIVTDLQMPEMGGLELLTRLRASGSQLPVIVVSAEFDETTRTRCERLGISGFLNKPFRVEELRTLIVKVVRQQESLA